MRSPKLPIMAKHSLHCIEADLLIPGRGEPIKNGCVVISDNIIQFTGKQSDCPAKYSSVPKSHVPYLLPGLWDCHLHFLGLSEVMALDAIMSISPTLAGARSARDCAATLNAGFTSVRELAGHGLDLAKAINEGIIMGPTIYSSHVAISQTGGHGDCHGSSLTSVLDAMHCGTPLCLADGVDECMKAVRLQLRRGAQVIKVCASGGVLSELDNPQDQQFSNAELKAIVEEANRAQRSVAAHCHGKKGIMAALEAGVSTIEHGTWLDDECLEIMKEKGVMLIATRSVVEGGMKTIDELPPASAKKMRETDQVHKAAYAKAVKSGVKIALGTDLGKSTPGHIMAHGNNGKELEFAVQAGMTELEAIEACTANGPLTLGLMGPKSGLLKEGYDADLIAVSKNPLSDIKVLADVDQVTHIWKGGKLVKAPGMPITFPR